MTDDEPTAKELQAAEFADERVTKIAEALGGVTRFDYSPPRAEIHGAADGTLHAEIRDAFLAGHLVCVMESVPAPEEENDNDDRFMLKRDAAIREYATARADREIAKQQIAALKAERDQARAEIATIAEARDQACAGWEREVASDGPAPHGVADARRLIAELRAIGKTP